MPTDTRQRLVMTAMQLFWEKGYGSTSVADVLQRAGVNSGSLYHFFPGKQDLLLAVLDAYREGIGAMLLEPAWKGVRDPIEKVFALLARYRKGIVDTECRYGCPIGSLALEIHEPDPPVRAAAGRQFRRMDDRHRGVSRRGRRTTAARPRPPRRLPTFVLTTMEGGVMQARTQRDVEYFDRSVRHLRDYFDLLLRDAGPRAPASTPSKRAPTRKRRRP